ncbi:PHD finger protein 11 [Dasypus novemcinctus]|uniref:PHD finger protein 11 n=1 Tax=Dasypus novemcinctus TaxID=9361 RepID=UPI000328F0F2|nr:PHD finger protein 11 [Dasypus novemcinctus]XP_058132786.1 PHD finger protein 11 [Dasypus novemcinctus]
MKKRTCALCPSNLECGVLYFAEKENIVAHENCLLYSSGLVECEVHVPFNHERNFDVGSVKKEISRGKWLTCSSCGEKGATVGCDVKACKRQYHFFCALSDSAAPDQYTYRVLCHEHKNSTKTHSGDIGGQTQDLPCGKRAPNHLSHSRPPGDSGASAASEEEERSADPHFPQPKETPCLSSPQEVTEERGKDTDVNGKAAFLKKCKEAGLLNDLFEVLLEKLIFIHERLMDDTTSEEGYEEIGTSLLGCRLFEDTFVNFQAAIENKIRQCEEKQQQMSTEIELLRDLKQTPCPL